MVLNHTWHRFHISQVFLDEDRAFEGTSGKLAFGPRVFQLVLATLLLFDANKHVREEITFELLPGGSIFAHSHDTVQSQFAESVSSH